LAAAAPGPDFLMVTQQTLSNGKKAGLFCSFGIALGLSVHITYSAFGLAAVIANSVNALLVIKMLGGSYLIYLGIKGVRSRPKKLENIPSAEIKAGSSLKSIGIGFFCNALNPKAPIYFVSLFTIVLSPNMPLHVIVIYGLWIMFLQFTWFAFVATILATPLISKRFRRFGHYVDRMMGGAMILLGVKVITSRTA
jgi:RhtB (resistance to homoserine/threonine) family protein